MKKTIKLGERFLYFGVVCKVLGVPKRRPIERYNMILIGSDTKLRHGFSSRLGGGTHFGQHDLHPMTYTKSFGTDRIKIYCDKFKYLCWVVQHELSLLPTSVSYLDKLGDK